MRGQGAIVGVTLAAVLLGALFLKGLAKEPPSDPTVSIDNGAPAGLLALKLWLAQRGVLVEARRDASAPLPDDDVATLFLVPPAAAASWSDHEVSALLGRVRAGSLQLLLVCDEDPAAVRRSRQLLGALGVFCAPTGEARQLARGTLPAYPFTLFVRGASRVGPASSTFAVPAIVDDEGRAVVLRRPVGEGVVTVLSSATVLANDGLGEADNAAFLLSLLPAGGRVVIDESHHKLRGAEALEKAFGGLGPQVAGIALLLLVPFVLFGFAPRRGDPPPAHREPEGAAAQAQARALAALYRAAGVDIEASTGLDQKGERRSRSGP